MHIEPGVVQGAKILLSYGTAAVSFGIAIKMALNSIKNSGVIPFIVKTIISTILVFIFFVSTSPSSSRSFRSSSNLRFNSIFNIWC